MVEKKKYNFWTILMMGVSATIGLSILVTFGSVAEQTKKQPLLMILTWIIGALLVVPDALIMSETAISFPGNGTAYYWLKKAKWRACSFWFGWILVFIFSATAIATATFALSGVVSKLLNIDIKYGKLIGIAILLILAVCQIYGKNFAGKSQIFFTALKALPIAFIFIIAIIYGRSDSFKNGAFTKELANCYIDSICLIPAIAMTLFAYTGMEAITYVSGEIENPRKTIPKAIIIGTIIVVTIYITLALAILAISQSEDWNSKNEDYKNVFYWAMANRQIPKAVSTTFLVLSLFIFVGSLNAFLLYQSRVISKMSEEGDLFRFFQKTNKTTNTPYYAIILLVILALLYLFVGDLETVVSSFTLGIIFLKLIMLAVVVYLRLTNQDYQKIYSNKVFWTLILISICAASITFIGVIIAYRNEPKKLWTCLAVLAVMLGGYPFYYVKIWIAKKLQQQKLAKQLELT